MSLRLLVKPVEGRLFERPGQGKTVLSMSRRLRKSCGDGGSLSSSAKFVNHKGASHPSDGSTSESRVWWRFLD